MNRFLFQTGLVTRLLSCNINLKHPIDAQQIDALALPKDATAFYFPFPTYTSAQMQNGRSKRDTLIFDWYSKMLFALHEPILQHYKGENEIYRFTWIRSFDHPVSIRLQKQGNYVQLSSRITNGAGGYEPGTIIWDTTFKASRENWNVLDSFVSNADFWTIPTEVDDGGRDGADWILEGVKDKQYHWAYRLSPDAERHTSFRNACDYMIRLSAMRIPPNRTY